MVARSLSSPRALLEIYVDLDRQLGGGFYAGTEAETAEAIVALAVAAVPGTEQASISDRRRGRFRTLISTGAVALASDEIQYALLSGPCVDAVTNNTVFCSADISVDPRWPEFGPRAHAETGVTSMLAFRLFFEEDPDRITGLNLYSTLADAFDDTSEIVGTVLSTHSALALSAAVARERTANLQRALTSNRRIGMAMGILMSSNKITENDAFTLLRIVSQNANRKLLDIADDVIDTGTLELPPATARSGVAPVSRKQGP